MFIVMEILWSSDDFVCVAYFLFCFVFFNLGFSTKSKRPIVILLFCYYFSSQVFLKSVYGFKLSHPVFMTENKDFSFKPK